MIRIFSRIAGAVALISACMTAVSCTNIDELSNDNSIAKFTVISHAPTSIEVLSDAEIKNDTIYIPVVFGKYDFPLKFYAKLHITQDIDKVVGINLDQEQCLQNINDELKFYVMAKSGLTRTYIVKAREIPLNENNYLSTDVKLSNLSPKLLHSQRALISAKNDTITLFTIGGTYPVIATPTFTIPEEAQFEDFENGTTKMQFNNENNVHLVKVISKSGAKRYWKVRVKCTPIVTAATPEIPASKLTSTNIDPRKVYVTPGTNSDCEPLVTNSNSTILLNLEAVAKSRSIEDGIIDFPYSLKFKFDTQPGIEIIKEAKTRTEGGVEVEVAEEADQLIFDSASEVRKYYLLDPLTGVARCWAVSPSQVLKGSNDILGITFEHVAADIPTEFKRSSFGKHTITKREPCIVLDPTKVEIHPTLGEIIIPTSALRIECVTWSISTGFHNYKADKLWNLKLNNISLTLPKNATTDIPTTMEWASNYEPAFDGGDGGGIAGLGGAVQNTCWTQPKTFTVTAQDGTVKNWKITLRDPQSSFIPSTACQLLGLSISRTIPNYAVVDDVTIDDETNSIAIRLKEDDDCYPLSIYSMYNTSVYSKVTSQNNGQSPLVFNTSESTQTITVTAQDGITTSDWTVSLIPPMKAEGADIETFSLTKFSTGFDFQQPVIDKDNATITLPLTGVGKLPLDIDYNMTITDKATSATPLRGTFNYKSLRDKISFEVMSQSGSPKLWTIVLHYCPQLPKSDFNTWSVVSNLNQPAEPWCTANNTSVKGTEPEDLGGGNSAASLKSSVLLGNFAAGSVFLGSFNFNMGLGLNDPISLTSFGYPFQATGKIKGVEAEIAYIAGTSTSYGANKMPFDYGSIVVELLEYNNKASDPSYSNFQYHGTYPDGSGPRTSGYSNNARAIASGEMFISNQAGTSHKNSPLNVVKAGQWIKVFVPINYPTGGNPDYTHIHVVFSSSAKGAIFTGWTTSNLKVDNVKLIYEE